MLIQFTLGNYKSIRNESTLNLIAINPIKEFEDDNVFELGRYRILKSAVIYGANASGKSNVIEALKYFKWFVINSSKNSQVDDPINIEPFLFHDSFKKKPTSFELSFIIEGTKFRYGVELNKTMVVSEYLLKSTKVKESPLFVRDEDGIEVFKEFKEGKGLEDKTRSNALFLSVVSQFNGLISGKIIKWFRSFNVISGLRDRNYEGVTAYMLKEDHLKDKIKNLIRKADLGISDISVNDFLISKETLPDDMSEEAKKAFLKEAEGDMVYNIDTFHKTYDENDNEAGLEIFDFDDQESEGTKKFFRLAGPIIDTLEKGKILVIDELDARLHPLLTRHFVKMFNSRSLNPNNAQLVFATHDTHLLNACTLRRDQIWFAEKDHIGGTEIYSLADYKLPKGKVRKDASFEKDYMRGKYGAIPFLRGIEKLNSN